MGSGQWDEPDGAGNDWILAPGCAACGAGGVVMTGNSDVPWSALLPFAVLAITFVAYCLFDLVRAEVRMTEETGRIHGANR